MRVILFHQKHNQLTISLIHLTPRMDRVLHTNDIDPHDLMRVMNLLTNLQKADPPQTLRLGNNETTNSPVL